MSKKSNGQWGIRLNREQKKILHIMTIPLIVIILIIIIRVADRPAEEETTEEVPTTAVMETGMTAEMPGSADVGDEERLPEEPGDEPDEPEETESEPETEPESQDEFATERFQRDSVPEILTLMETYFKAREMADVQTMNQLYGIEEVSAQELETRSVQMRSNSKYVQGFENVATYVMEGVTADSWLVYAVADINFYSSKTRAPMIQWCYVTRDGEGNYRLRNNRDLSSAEMQFIEEANHSDEVRRLASDVNRRLREALASDENLSSVYGVLRDGSPVWEGTGETEPEVEIVGQEENSGIDLEAAPEQENGQEDGAIQAGAEESGDVQPESVGEGETGSETVQPESAGDSEGAQ